MVLSSHESLRLNLACKTEHPFYLYLVVFVTCMGISSEVWNFFFDFNCKTVWVPTVYNMMIVVVVAETQENPRH